MNPYTDKNQVLDLTELDESSLKQFRRQGRAVLNFEIRNINSVLPLFEKDGPARAEMEKYRDAAVQAFIKLPQSTAIDLIKVGLCATVRLRNLKQDILREQRFWQKWFNEELGREYD